jgi:hypothetical protein
LVAGKTQRPNGEWMAERVGGVGASLRTGYRNDMNSILAKPEDNLKRELLYAACAVSRIHANVPPRIGFDLGKRRVYGDTEIASGFGAAFRVPVRGRLHLGRRCE